MKLKLSEHAKNDLIDIRVYTIENFGESQAAHYRGRLEQGFSILRRFPQIGLVDKRLPRGHQAIKVAHHWICYEICDDVIEVNAVIRGLDVLDGF